MKPDSSHGRPDALTGRLKELKLDSWAALRRERDPEALAKKLNITPDETRDLKTHAHLAQIAGGAKLREALISNGFHSASEIADTGVTEFARRLPGVEPATLARLRRNAQAVRNLVRLQAAGAAGSHALKKAGYTGSVIGGKKKKPGSGFNLRDWPWKEPAEPEKPCVACTGCNAAVSPAAYFLELLDFTQDTFRSASSDSVLSMASLEARFLQKWDDLPVDCASSLDAIRQVRIAIEVLERFIQKHRSSWDRAAIYAQMRSLAVSGDPLATPDVLARIYDAYLTELGTTRSEIAASVASGTAAQDLLAARVRLSRAQLTSLNRADDEIGIAEVEGFPALVTASIMSGVASDATSEEVAAAEQRAGASLDRVEEAYSARVRDNLVRIALTVAPDSVLARKTVDRLANWLSIDLTGSACCTVTRIGQGILTLQTFLQAYRLGREEAFLSGYQKDWNEPRWRWTQSYATWHAAQMIYLYPENYLLHGLRRSQTPPFSALLEAIRQEDYLTPAAIREAVENYGRQIGARLTNATGSSGGYTVPIGDVCALVTSVAATADDEFSAVDIQLFDFNGQWLGWERIAGLPASPEHQLMTAVSFQSRLYLIYSRRDTDAGAYRFTLTWVDPRLESLQKLTTRVAEFATWPSLIAGELFNVFSAAAVAGPRHVNFYLRWMPSAGDGAAGQVVTANLRLDRDHRSALIPSGLPLDNPPSGASADLKTGLITPLAHVNGRDYLLRKGPTRDWIIELEHVEGTLSYSNLPTFGQAWPASTSTRLGQVQAAADGTRLVLLQGSGAPRTITFFDRANGNLNWIDVPGDNRPARGEHLLWDGGRLAVVTDFVSIFAFDGMQVTRLLDAALAMTPAQWSACRDLPPSPRMGEALRLYRERQLELWQTIGPAQGLSRVLFDEWFLFIPLAVARTMNEMGAFQEAADWYHLVFHPFNPVAAERLIYAGFSEESGDLDISYRKGAAWLRDPFDPYTIADLREHVYLHHTLLMYLENLLDWADQLFTRDTQESIDYARRLYQLALELLGFDEMALDPCQRRLRGITYQITREYDARIADRVARRIEAVATAAAAGDVMAMLDRIGALIDQRLPAKKFEHAVNKKIQDISQRRAGAGTKTVAKSRKTGKDWREWFAGSEPVLVPDGGIDLDDGPDVGDLPEIHWVPDIATYDFCIPPNPLVDWLRFRAESNLEKIRYCRNFAGLKRDVAPDTAALVVPPEPPPLYRYEYLIERAKYFISLAQQLDSKLLGAIEKEEAEAYSALQAQQHKKTASQQVKLQRLRAKEADASIDLAILQRNRVDVQHRYFDELIQSGVSDFEIGAFHLVGQAMGQQGASVIASALTGNIPGTYSSAASVFSSGAELASMLATWERREQEWKFQRDLAVKDLQISEQQIRIANIGKEIADKEVDISTLNAAFADDMVSFLNNKFANVELYRWMARTIRGIYREHLGSALVLARMAQSALSFERQEAVNIVGNQYWDNDRRGLLAADNLLADLSKLDQHRFSTRERLRELTKHVSLAGADPLAFSRLKNDGVMEFATLLSWFDRDFPGHYMRAIKTVSLTFVALVPPGEGVHATLRNSGISRIVVGSPFAEPRTVIRQPEAVSLTVPNDGTGLFRVDLDGEMLLPFERLGLESAWTLELPHGANRFDYSTLIDIVMTLKYTALESEAYRQQLLRRIGTVRTDSTTGRQFADVPAEAQAAFSVHNRFPDAWYHFHNPIFLPLSSTYGYDAGQTWPPFGMQLHVKRSLLPANESDHKTSRVTLIASGAVPGPVPLEIAFTPEGTTQRFVVHADLAGGRLQLTSQTPLVGGGNLPLGAHPPFGKWTVRIRNEATGTTYDSLFAGSTTVDGQKKLDIGWLTDLIFVVQYTAATTYPLV